MASTHTASSTYAYDLGCEAFSAGQYKKAAQHFRVALEQSPNDPRLHAFLASIAAAHNDHGLAFTHFQEVDRLIIATEDVLLALAILAQKLGRLSNCLEYLKRAASRFAESKLAEPRTEQAEFDLLDMGYTLLAAGESDGIMCVQEVLAFGSPVLADALGTALKACADLRGTALVASSCLKLVEQLPGHDFAPLLLMKWVGNFGRASLAHQLLTQMVQINPKRWRCWATLGHLASASNDAMAASDYFAKAIECSPDTEALYPVLAEVLIQAGEFDRALKTIEAGLLRSTRSRMQLACLRVSVHSARGFPAQAIELAQQLVRENESSGQAWRMLAEVLCGYGLVGAAATVCQGLAEVGVEQRQIDEQWAKWYRCQYQFGIQSTLLESLWQRHPDDLDLAGRLMTAKLLDGDVMGALSVDQHIDAALARQAAESQRLAWRRGFQRSILREFNTNRDAIDALARARQLPVALQVPRLIRDLEQEPNYVGFAILILVRLRQLGVFAKLEQRLDQLIPRRIHQYWDQAKPPDDVLELMGCWQNHHPAWAYQRFNDATAWDFLDQHTDRQTLRAFETAAHPTLRADLLRLAVLEVQGGVWADADDRAAQGLEVLIEPGVDLMLVQENIGTIGNNFIASAPNHPFMRYALKTVTEQILERQGDSIWFLSGPGALTLAFCHFYKRELRQLTLPAGVRIVDTFTLSRTVAQHLPLAYKHRGAHWNHQKQRNRSLFRNPGGRPRAA